MLENGPVRKESVQLSLFSIEEQLGTKPVKDFLEAGEKFMKTYTLKSPGCTLTYAIGNTGLCIFTSNRESIDILLTTIANMNMLSVKQVLIAARSKKLKLDLDTLTALGLDYLSNNMPTNVKNRDRLVFERGFLHGFNAAYRSGLSNIAYLTEEEELSKYQQQNKKNV